MVQHIFLVRHGDTALNDKHLIRGWTDVPLSPKGIDAAKRLGKQLAKEQIGGIATSDLVRASDTALFIKEATGKPILTITKKLRTWDLGIYTGQPSEKADKDIKVYIEKNPDKTIPEGESFNDYKKRLLDTFLGLLEKYKDLALVIVNHHSGLAVIEAWVASGADPDYEIDPIKMSKRMTTEGIKPGEYEHFHGIWSSKQGKLV